MKFKREEKLIPFLNLTKSIEIISMLLEIHFTKEWGDENGVEVILHYSENSTAVFILNCRLMISKLYASKIKNPFEVLFCVQLPTIISVPESHVAKLRVASPQATTKYVIDMFSNELEEYLKQEIAKRVTRIRLG